MTFKSSNLSFSKFILYDQEEFNDLLACNLVVYIRC